MAGNKGQGIVLQERDRRLLSELGVMRVIDRELAKRIAGFRSTTRANARLLTLTRAGYLRRFFMGTEAGGTQALYTLSREGERLTGAAFPGLRRKEDEVLVADFYVSHQLSVNRVHCALKHEPIPVPDCQFLRFVSFREPIASGASLIPDGYAEVSEGTKLLAMFLEIDLASESLPVWKKKVSEYLRYAVSGISQTQWGLAQFRVLVVANTEERMNPLRRATASLTDKIFWFTSLESIRASGFWGPIWFRPKGDGPQALLGSRP